MRPAVMPPPNFIEESGKMYTQPHIPKLPKPRFQKGSPEAKAYMASIRNNKEVSGFFKKIGRDVRKVGNKGKLHFLENELVMKQISYCPLLGLLSVELLEAWQADHLVVLWEVQRAVLLVRHGQMTLANEGMV